MTLEDILNALHPLLHEDESATITKSDDFGDRMIAVEGAARKTNIYDYDGMYVWYSQPGGGAWAADSADAMSEQLATMLDYARTSPLSGDLREQEAREATPAYLLEQLPDLFAGGAPAITGTLPDGTEIAEIDYGSGAIHIEKGRNTDFSAWAITRSHRWPASKRDLSQAREAITDILAAIKTAN
nr:MAG TPA: hypothetical protein [Caudoviricetes sp.]